MMPVSCFHLPNIKYVKIARCCRQFIPSMVWAYQLTLVRFDLHQAIPEADLPTGFIWTTFAQNYPNYAPKKGPCKERKTSVSPMSPFSVCFLFFNEFLRSSFV